MIEKQYKQWKIYEVGELFEIYTGGDLILSNLESGNIPVISHSISNNGVVAYSKEIGGRRKFDCNKTISLADRGNFYAYVQKEDFYIGTRVKALELKYEGSNKNLLKFICPTINAQAEKFSYGNNCCDSTDSLKILLPTKDDKPDWNYMDMYIREIENKKKDISNRYIKNKLKDIHFIDIPKLEEKQWGHFEFNRIFKEIKRGKRLKKDDHLAGDMPYISSRGENNGLDGFIGNKDNVRIYERCITLANSGSVGKAFYHPYTFVASDHVTKLENKEMSEYIYIFLLPLISRLQEKYNFNREINDIRINREVLLLPITEHGLPDWNYMEQYAKNTIYTHLIRYKDYSSEI